MNKTSLTNINSLGLGRDTFGGRPRGGPGGGPPPPDTGEFLKKIAKMHYFSIFSNFLTNHSLIFRAFGRKAQIFRKFSKFFKIFLRKFLRIPYFNNFSKDFNKPCVIFSHVWTMYTNFAKF